MGDKKIDLETAHESLKQFFDAIMPIPSQVWEACLPAWQLFSAKRRTILTAAGERERYLYFVLEGIQRIYYLNDQGNKEATLVFTYPPSLSGIADSLLSQQPSRFYLETITASTFIRIPQAIYLQQYDQYPELNTLFRVMIASTLEGILLRQAELQTEGAAAKFKALLTRSPHVLNLIPHKYLASYLGIDPTTFSKLLGKVKL
ncbi:MAG: Crp/Fnr family transcriptional regulator [Bacteroidota bacterium]